MTRSLILLATVVVVLSGCTIGRPQADLVREIHAPLAPSDLDRPVPADDLRADLALLVQTIDEVHPGPYRRLSREAFVRAVDSLGATLDGPRTRLEFFLAVQPLVARLGDGHTAVYYPSGEVARLRQGGAVFFPALVSVQGDVIIARTATGGVVVGDTLAAIDGVLGSEWAERVRRLHSGESSAMQEAHGSRRFAQYHALFDRDGGPFRVRVGGETHQLDGVVWDSLRAARSRLAPAQRWAYETRPDGVGMLTVRAFSGGLAAFEAFLDGAVAQARADSAVALVVDVRDNPGGDSRQMTALLDRLTKAPYRIASRTEHRRSHQYGRFWKQKFVGSAVLRGLLRLIPIHRLHPVSRRYYAAPVGTNVVTELPLEAPPPERTRFEVPVAIAISAYSASAAVVLAATVQDHGLGVVVGEESGQWATMHGEAYYFELPHARLLAGVSTYRIVRPSGSEAPGGVVPDIETEAEEALGAAVRHLLTL